MDVTCVEHAVFLEINLFYLCIISISENSTGGLIIDCLCQVNFSALVKLTICILVYYIITISKNLITKNLN